MLDAIIVGAGAAGLEAARFLRSAGARILILEARDRIGGRVRDVGESPSFALGAEFLHGRAEESRALLTRFAEPYYRIDPDFQIFERGRLRKAPDFWQTLSGAFRKIRPTRADRSFEECLRAVALSPLERKLASGFIEGFDAAELGKISANAVNKFSEMTEDPENRAFGRALSGYGRLLHALAAEADAWKNIRFGSVVDSIEWKRGEARVSVKGRLGFSFRAKHALVTVPIGVLKAREGEEGRIRFVPELPRREEALGKVEMGHVVRIALEFEPSAYADWTRGFEGGLPFILSPGLRFSSWWSFRPIQWPAIVAWAGGDRAIELSTLSAEERVAAALQDLSAILDVRVSTLSGAMVRAYHHDWSADPYSRGAYSYPGVGAEEALARLERPVAKTIWFAGEAFDLQYGGTVEGAILSGRKQARRIARSLGLLSPSRSRGSRRARGAPDLRQ